MSDQLTIKPPVQKMTTPQLLAALRAHYVKPTALSERHPGAVGDTDLLVEEVPAPGTTRRCDLLRVGLWASRGHRIIVHEIKTSRSDFLRELEDPAKAEAWWPYCHEFYIVAPDGLLRPDEIPAGWGLMVPPAKARSRRFQIRKPASVKDPKLTPQLLVEITKRVDNARLKQIGELNYRHQDDLAKAARTAATQRATAELPHDVRRRLELLEQLEGTLGTRLDNYSRIDGDGEVRAVGAADLGEALKDFVHAHVALQDREGRLDQKARALRSSAKRVIEGLDAFPTERGR